MLLLLLLFFCLEHTALNKLFVFFSTIMAVFGILKEYNDSSYLVC